MRGRSSPFGWTGNRSILLCVIFLFSMILLFVCAGNIPTSTKEHYHLLISTAEILACLLPAMLYLKTERRDTFSWLGCRVTLPTLGRTLLFSVSLFLLGVLGVALFQSMETASALYGFLKLPIDFSFSALVAFALVPAIAEAVLCFGVLAAHAEGQGRIAALLVPTLLFGSLAFSFSHLPWLLLAGGMLTFARFSTGSFLPALLASLFFRVGAFLTAVGALDSVREALPNEIVFLVLLGILLLCVYLLAVPYLSLRAGGCPVKRGGGRGAVGITTFAVGALALSLVLALFASKLFS